MKMKKLFAISLMTTVLLSAQQFAFSSDAVAEAYLEQGKLLLQRGQLEAAYKILLKADFHLHELSSKGLYGDKVYAGVLYANLGECARQLSNTPAYRSQRAAMLSLSEQHLSEALRIKEEAYGTDAIEVAKVLENLGTTFYDDDKFAESEAVFRKAVQIRERNEGAQSCSLFYSLYKLGQIASHSGSKLNDAESFFQRSLGLASTCFGVNDARVGKIHQELGYGAYLKGRKSIAIDHFDKAVRIFKLHGPETKKNLQDCRKTFKPLIDDLYIDAYRQFIEKRDSKPTQGPDLIPYVNKLIIACRRLEEPKDLDYLTRLARQLAKKTDKRHG